MPGHRFGHVLVFDKLDQPQLHCVISVFTDSLALHDNTRTRLNHGDRDGRAVFSEHLGHSNFLA